MKLFFIERMLHKISCKIRIMRVGEGIRHIMKQRAKYKIAERGTQSDMLKLLYTSSNMRLYIFRIVTAERAVMDGASDIGQQVIVRFDAAEQKCPSVPPKSVVICLDDQLERQRFVISCLHEQAPPCLSFHLLHAESGVRLAKNAQIVKDSGNS